MKYIFCACTDAADPVDEFREALLSAYGTSSMQHFVAVEWPIFMILAKDPEPPQCSAQEDHAPS